MGKLLTVNSGYSAVLLPSQYGLRNYNPGDQVTVTDAEYNNFTQATTQAVTVTTSGLPDPTRPSSDRFAEAVSSQTFAGATGGPVTSGVNFVTGPAAGVTYSANGFLQAPLNNPGAYPAVVGATPGSQTDIEVYHVQGAVVSVAPTAKSWFYTRVDAAGATTNASPVVLDAAILATDVGKPVSGAGIPASSFVGTVVPGVSFRISSTQATQTDANATATATGVAVTIGATTKWPAGTVPTFTASVGAIDYFRFLSIDGGVTWYNINTQKGLA